MLDGTELAGMEVSGAEVVGTEADVTEQAGKGVNSMSYAVKAILELTCTELDYAHRLAAGV